MIHSSLITLFCLISIAGVVVYFFKQSQVTLVARLSLLFFVSCHTFLLTIAIAQHFILLPLLLFAFAIVLMFISRICNGLVLFGRNNWTHYVVTGSLMLFVFVLYLYDI